jgi:hypothetical protein
VRSNVFFQPQLTKHFTQSHPWHLGQRLDSSSGVSVSSYHSWESAYHEHSILYKGQTSGVAISSAVFQSRLASELRQRIHGPDAAEVSICFAYIPVPCRLTFRIQVIMDIRHSLSLVTSLPPDLQRAARDSYAASLRTVFILAACSTLTAYIVRLPVSFHI